MEKQIGVKYSVRKAIQLMLMEVQGIDTAADCSDGKLVTLFLPQQLWFCTLTWGEALERCLRVC